MFARYLTKERSLIMTRCLLIDFGSTFTKLTAVHLESATILGSAKSKTTVETNIIEGFNHAKDKLLSQLDSSNHTFDHNWACSSAKGGFRMVAIGLSKTLTAEAAKRVALGAGTRILKVYSYGLKDEDIEEINQLQPDIILVSGGTNGGNTVGIINDANKLTQLNSSIPIVVAGNEEAYSSISHIFDKHSMSYYLTENVMPQVNVLNPDPTRQILRRIFMEQIVEAKGMEVIEEQLGTSLIPTPSAVLQAAELLSKGTTATSGLGDLLIVDIGGATTDLHSVGDGKPIDPTIRMERLQEPFEKRTVEGDLGMRYSALSLLESTTYQAFTHYLPNLSEDTIYQECYKRAHHPEMVATTEEEHLFDEAMGKIAIETAFNRHAGTYRREPTPTRVLLYQSGKDLKTFHTIIGTGGILVNSQHSKSMMEASLRKENDPYLKPVDSSLYLDASYMLSAMGTLAEHYPEEALAIMKKYLTKL